MSGHDGAVLPMPPPLIEALEVEKLSFWLF